MCNFADLESIKDEFFSGYNPGWNHLLNDDMFTKLSQEIMRRNTICVSAKQFLMRFESQAYHEFLERYQTLISGEFRPCLDKEEDLIYWNKKTREELE